MKSHLFSGILTGILLFTTLATQAHPGPNPMAHAPAGMMSEHMHSQGQTMLALRYQRSTSSDYYQGSRRVDASVLAEAGYTMMAADMTMDMLMLDLMYAPTDRLTLMLMPHYMRMDMTMQGTGAMIHNDHEADDHGHQNHGGHGRSHSVSGIGDTLLTGLYELAVYGPHQLIGSLGVYAPTGSVSERNANGQFVHYSMQLGSGTWDLAPSFTYRGKQGLTSWGAQINARIPMESRNDSGYALGDRRQATTWGALQVAPWASLSARLAYEHQDAIRGHYNGPHSHASPADIQGNYGGEHIDAGLGANLVFTSGPMNGLRLEFEWVTRLDENYNGIQLSRGDQLNLNTSYAF